MPQRIPITRRRDPARRQAPDGMPPGADTSACPRPAGKQQFRPHAAMKAEKKLSKFAGKP